MKSFVKFFTRACTVACILFIGISCKDTDEFVTHSGERGRPVSDEANSFEFTTTKDVDLLVDYSAVDTHGPVLFSIYTVNPIVNENTDYAYVDESISPVFAAYTNEKGKFESIVTLPTYAKVLHIVTGDIMVGLRRMMVEVVNGEAEAVLKTNVSATRAMPFRAAAAGETDDMTPLFNFYCNINSSGKQYGQPVYKEWLTPLGKWENSNGRPKYLLDPATASPGLIFPTDIVEGLYETAKKALNSGTTCKEQYRASTDMTLIKDSEVSITGLGSFTCWCNSLGYYFYDQNSIPQSTQDLNIIMLFPNTQDGKRYDKCDYNGSIGMLRGDAIQLMYYPNIANNGDLSGATKIFPKGTKIGFIVKSNGWGCIDQAHSFNYGGWKTKKMNIWAASTEGMSYCYAKDKSTADIACGSKWNYPNANGEARTAKFAYVAPNGDQYTIISVEDACDDQDFDDLIFALNPANAFTEQAIVEDGKTTTVGVYAFEDKWPNRGDYDMNDVMVECEHEMYFDSKGLVTKERFRLTTDQNYVTLVSGLAARLTTKVNPKSVVMKKIAPNSTQETNASYVSEKESGSTVYYLTEDVTAELKSSYIIELTYSSGQSLVNLAQIEPFIYRIEDGKVCEIHLPNHTPTQRMDWSFFGTGDDLSEPTKGKYYVRNSLYPFAFYLANARLSSFEETILMRKNESIPIDQFYPEFIHWAVSNGEANPEWYLHPFSE